MVELGKGVEAQGWAMGSGWVEISLGGGMGSALLLDVGGKEEREIKGNSGFQEECQVGSPLGYIM